MIFHRIEPRYTADNERLVRKSPNTAQRASRRRIRPHQIGIDAVRHDRNAIGRQAAHDRIGAHGARIGDDEVGAPREPRLRPIGKRIQRIIVAQLHPAGAQPEHQFRLDSRRQQQRRQRRLHREKGIDHVRTFAQKKPAQSDERCHHVPTARLADGKKANAAVAEQSLERASRVQARLPPHHARGARDRPPGRRLAAGFRPRRGRE